MMQMLNKTKRACKGRCQYGRKCCGSMLDSLPGKRKRHTLRQGERATWKREVDALR